MSATEVFVAPAQASVVDASAEQVEAVAAPVETASGVDAVATAAEAFMVPAEMPDAAPTLPASLQIGTVAESLLAAEEAAGITEASTPPGPVANDAEALPAPAAGLAVAPAVLTDPAILRAVQEVTRQPDPLEDTTSAEKPPAFDAPAAAQDPARPSGLKRPRKNGSRRKS